MHRELPGKLESRNLSRDNLAREIGRRPWRRSEALLDLREDLHPPLRALALGPEAAPLQLAPSATPPSADAKSSMCRNKQNMRIVLNIGKPIYEKTDSPPIGKQRKKHANTLGHRSVDYLGRQTRLRSGEKERRAASPWRRPTGRQQKQTGPRSARSPALK